MVLWLDDDAAPSLTARTAGVGSFSAVAALTTMAGMAVTGALIVGAITISGGWG